MPITPQDIEQLAFSPSKHGYDTEEVDQFLEQLAVEVDAMLQKIADLKGRLTASDQALEAARAQVATLQNEVAQSQQQVVPVSAAAASTSGATEQQISKALIVAQQSADRIVADARESADKIRTEADQKAREVIRQALAEKQNELDEIDRLKASREEFRAEYKQLLQHFMDDADTAFPASASSVFPAQAATYEVPSAPAAHEVDVNATVYVPASDAAGFAGLDDLD